MGRSCCRGGSSSNALRLAAVGLLSLGSIVSISGCGKGAKAGPPLFPGKVNLTPSNNTSVELGATFVFTASAQTATGTNLAVPITFSSSDTAIVNVAANGVACAGHWDVAFTTCTPGATGLAQVTATALKESSVPTFVFVHPHVDSVTVTGILLDGVPVQEPCLSQGQSMTLEAHAFSQGSDVTSSVGPFTFTAQNPSVVTMVGVVNTAFNFPTNQTTATAVIPGMTQIYASASGVSSSSFHQPQYQNSQGTTSPVLDFFETCPIQSINLEVGLPGSQQTGQTTFVASSSQTSTQTATAVLTDVMGNTSLPNTFNGIVLSKIPLTWSASQPAVVGISTGCQQSCVLKTPLPGSGSITASCSPPTCNVGFPLIPASLSTPSAIAACTNFFQSLFPKGFSCQQLIPVPVYASVPAPGSPLLPGTGLTAEEDDGAISGLVTGNPAGTSLLATSMGCAHLPNTTCTTSAYSLSTAKATPGPENPLPASPNSLLFDPAGDKAFMGSDFGALLINPGNFGTNSSPFTGLGTVTGKVLATSSDGTTAVFSDTLHTPNQVYVVNAAAANSLSATPLNISQAVASAFSPDGLKAFIFGNGGGSLYVFSPQQALQAPIALAGTVNANSVAFSSNGAFAFVAEASANGSAANLTAFNTCNNQVATSPPTGSNPSALATVPLPGNPLFLRVLPGLQIEGRDSSGYPIPDGQHVLVLDATGVDILTATVTPPVTGTLCPQTLTFISGNPTASSANPASLVQRVELGQGTLQPINFFASADGSQLYAVAAGHASILVYNFAAGAVTSGIELLGNATPLSADMSADAGTILIAGSDGLLHEVSTGLGGSDQVQLSFPNLPDYLNSFCAYTTPQNPCTLNLVVARP